MPELFDFTLILRHWLCVLIISHYDMYVTNDTYTCYLVTVIAVILFCLSILVILLHSNIITFHNLLQPVYLFGMMAGTNMVHGWSLR